MAVACRNQQLITIGPQLKVQIFLTLRIRAQVGGVLALCRSGCMSADDATFQCAVIAVE